MSATITLRTPHGAEATLAVARVVYWRRFNDRTGPSTIVVLDGAAPTAIPGDHSEAIRAAVEALASIEDDAQTIAELTARVEQLERAVAKLLQEQDR